MHTQRVRAEEQLSAIGPLNDKLRSRNDGLTTGGQMVSARQGPHAYQKTHSLLYNLEAVFTPLEIQNKGKAPERASDQSQREPI